MSDWRLIYKHDENGNRLEGDKHRLLSHVINGADVKVAYLTKKDPNYIFWIIPQLVLIKSGEVFAQGSSWGSDFDSSVPPRMVFYKNGFYILNVSSSGLTNRRINPYPTGNPDDEDQKHMLAWYTRT